MRILFKGFSSVALLRMYTFPHNLKSQSMWLHKFNNKLKINQYEYLHWVFVRPNIFLYSYNTSSIPTKTRWCLGTTEVLVENKICQLITVFHAFCIEWLRSIFPFPIIQPTTYSNLLIFPGQCTVWVGKHSPDNREIFMTGKSCQTIYLH